MAVKITKPGEKLSLKKADDSSVKRVRIELSWETDSALSNYKYDLDAITLATSGTDLGKSVAEELVCFYGQQETPFAVSSGDNTSGNSIDGNGNKVPDEVIKIDFTKLPDNVEHVPVVINLHKAKIRSQSLATVKNITTRAFDEDTNLLLVESTVNTTDKSATSLLFVVFNRIDLETFEYEQVSKTFNRDLAGWLTEFGVDFEA